MAQHPTRPKIIYKAKHKYDKILQLNLSVKEPNENRNQNSTV